MKSNEELVLDYINTKPNKSLKNYLGEKLVCRVKSKMLYGNNIYSSFLNYLLKNELKVRILKDANITF